MTSFVYRCPATGLNVQGLVVDYPAPASGDDTYEAVTCTACHRAHLVNPVTGRVAGVTQNGKIVRRA